MKKSILTVIAYFLLATVIYGQAGPGSRLAWESTGVADPAIAAGLIYKYYPDGATTGTVLANVTCTGPVAPATEATCVCPLPAFTTGSHSIEMTSSDGTAESLKSTPLNFTFVVLLAPGNVRILPG